MAKAKGPASRMKTLCGTSSYLAPEILEMKSTGIGYDKQVDCWSLGVVLYVMLSGTLPFWEDEDHALYEQIRKGDFEFYGDVWEEISPHGMLFILSQLSNLALTSYAIGKDLISRLLRINPLDRLTIDGVLSHPWLSLYTRDLDALYSKMLNKSCWTSELENTLSKVPSKILMDNPTIHAAASAPAINQRPKPQLIPTATASVSSHPFRAPKQSAPNPEKTISSTRPRPATPYTRPPLKHSN